MSKSRYNKITCPKCNTEGNYLVWHSINVDIDPDTREKVKNRTLFEYICPNCGEAFEVEYNTLYHDCMNRFMIYYFSKVDDEEIKAIEKNEKLNRLLKDYKLRIVFSKNDLIEKITLFEQNMDDIVIEMIKNIIFSELSEEKVENLLGIYFVEKNCEQFIFELVYKNGFENARVPEHVYNDIANDYKINHPKGFTKINMTNVITFFEEK